MAFYEMLPGAGMPPGLQAGMDSVLNKKFGTSTTYPAEDWPDTVNLMGPLPEKTASGAIVTFSDGADDVPLKKCEITLPASLDGYSEVNVVNGGKNFLSSAPAETKTNNSVSITCDGNGKYTLSGTATGGSSNIRFELSEPSKIANGMYLHFKNNTYTTVSSLTFERADQTQIFSLTLAPADRIYDMSSYAGEEVYYIRFYVVNNGAVDYFLSPMFCFESSATTYEPYTAPTTHTATLGRTIHGGTVDVVKGTGTDDRLRYDLDENDNWGVYGGADHSYWHNVATGEGRPIDVTKLMESICNHLTFSSSPIASAPDFTFGIQGGQRIVVTADSSINTLDKFKTWLETHPLEFIVASANPSTFTFTPITPTPETALGTNNFWADSGDSSVTYRADINLALGGN